MNVAKPLPGSFRDASGFVFLSESGEIRRQVNRSYRKNYDHLITSGLYEKLVEGGLLVSHEEKEAEAENKFSGPAYKVITPKKIGFISYPYEWCFDQLKDAALLTLKIQECALQHGMMLKDASAYNVQFDGGKPVFIDTLSFEKYPATGYWKAYKQFCEHFLGPLSLTSHLGLDVNPLMRNYLDGLPLSFVSKLLPFRSYFQMNLLIHIHLHGKSQKNHEGDLEIAPRKMSMQRHRAILDSLSSAIQNMKYPVRRSTWNRYYKGDHNYDGDAMKAKMELVKSYLESVRPETLWDLGCNTGVFSEIGDGKAVSLVSMDSDAACINELYLKVKTKEKTSILPLVIDLTNPSHPLGWAHRERMSLQDRGPADCLLALAVIHHLALSNNVPFSRIAEYFSLLGNCLIIEFVPAEDSQARKLLLHRKREFPNYNIDTFKSEFSKFFSLVREDNIGQSQRTLFLFKKR